MAAPGTNTLTRHDSTTKLRHEHRQITTQAGGTRVITSFHRIVAALATFAEYVSEPDTLSVVISSDAEKVTVYSTSETPRLVHLHLMGE